MTPRSTIFVLLIISISLGLASCGGGGKKCNSNQIKDANGKCVPKPPTPTTGTTPTTPTTGTTPTTPTTGTTPTTIESATCVTVLPEDGLNGTMVRNDCQSKVTVITCSLHQCVDTGKIVSISTEYHYVPPGRTSNVRVELVGACGRSSLTLLEELSVTACYWDYSQPRHSHSSCMKSCEAISPRY